MLPVWAGSADRRFHLGDLECSRRVQAAVRHDFWIGIDHPGEATCLEEPPRCDGRRTERKHTTEIRETRPSADEYSDGGCVHEVHLRKVDHNIEITGRSGRHDRGLDHPNGREVVFTPERNHYLVTVSDRGCTTEERF